MFIKSTMTPELVDVKALVPGYESLDAAYHNYTIEWQASHIAWYVDGIEIRRYTDLESTMWQSLRLSDWTGCDAGWCGELTLDEGVTLNFEARVLYRHWCVCLCDFFFLLLFTSDRE